MDIESPSNPLQRTMLRPEDATRMPRSLRADDHEKPRAASEDTRMKGEQKEPGLGVLDDSPLRNEDAASLKPAKPEAALLSLEETTELFRTKVEDARQDTVHALAGSEDVSEAVKPKLTLDLGHSNIARLPETVVDIIKAEVERLSLSHNQIWHIPLRFSECLHLRYLNIRSNIFREIPRGVYRLILLEILDISRNKVRKISKDIKNLSCLRVFSIAHNRVDDLPSEICEMSKLQILKVGENPLRFKLKKIIEAKESELAAQEMTDHEKETAVTAEIKRHLRDVHPMLTSLDVESGGEISEGPVDTPKPLKRALSSRFPVIPSTASSDTAPDSMTPSPNQGRPPPIPTRSHYRIASGQSGGNSRRPGISPLISGNERNRSNSESVLQASAAARNKRMGMLRKEKSDLGTVEEARSNRHSHLRGFSHGSTLRSRNGSVSSAGGGSSSSPSSPRDPRRQRLGFVKRLSSLPEHKRENEWSSPVTEGAKGILYALYQIHPQISGLIVAIKGKESRRGSLELTFYNASSHVDRLNEAIEHAESVNEEDAEAMEAAEDTVNRDCATCIMAYAHVITQLQDNIKKIVAGTDARYVRTLMLLVYGSINEIKIAVRSFGVEIESQQRQPSSGTMKRIQSIPEELSTPQQSIRAITPTRDRVVPTGRAGPRLRSDTAIQHPILEDVRHYPPNGTFSQGATSTQPPTPAHPLVGSMNSVIYNSSVFRPNRSTYNSASGSSLGFRSRSSSRNTNNLNSASPSLSSSVANTPRSGEVFHLPPPQPFSSGVNPATGLTDAQEESVFEQIFLALTRAYDSALQAIPIAKRQFVRRFEAAEENRQPKEIRGLWSTLIWRCNSCVDASEALQIRLVNMRLKDPVVSINGSGSGRNDPSFWQLCMTFMQSFVELVTDMKEAKDRRLLPSEIVGVLRPVQKASREAGRLIETSPWRHLTDAGAAATAVSPPSGPYGPSHTAPVYSNVGASAVNGISSYPPQVMHPHQHYVHPSSSSLQQLPFPPPLIPIPPVPNSATNTTLNGVISPASVSVSVPIPATPLSAALGPAAQATIPSTPAATGGGNSTASSFGSDQFFAGNVFQRADSLLSMPQVQIGGMGFLNRR